MGTRQTEISDEICASMSTWRRDFHRHPELGFEESRTAGIVAGLLRDAGLEVHEGVGGTGVVGLLKRGTGKRSIGLRADMDALAINEENTFDHRSTLEERMHACGHDGHTTMLLGAAHHLAAQGSFEGTATFIFQPAEEHGLGAQAMIDDGLFERFPVDAVYAIHNLPGIDEGTFVVRNGPIMACEDTFEIEIEGAGTHAALPHKGVDPILIGSEIVTALQSITSRTIDPLDNAVVSVTNFSCDGVRNVIPSRVTLAGDVRSFGAEIQDHIESTMNRIAEGICLAHGAKHVLRYDREFIATINSQDESDRAARVAEDSFGLDKVDRHHPPLMASEDFGFMLKHKPGAYVLLGNGQLAANSEGAGEARSGGGLHSPVYDFNDRIAPTGAAFWTALVESELQ